MSAARWWLIAAGLLGAVGVGLGAYGAHGLRPQVEQAVDAAGVASGGGSLTAAEREAEIAHRMDNWKTGVQYQMVHVAALLAIGLASAQWPLRRWCFAGVAMLAGMVMFSGMLYYQALAPERRLGIVVMFGGISYILGWLLLAAAAFGFKETSK